MLVLGRKVNEAFVIDKHIRVVILSIHHDRVKLGIEAPRIIPILREELIGRNKDD